MRLPISTRPYFGEGIVKGHHDMEAKHAVLITGSAIRLGKAIAIGMAQRNYDIAIHYHRSDEAARKTAAEIQSYGVDCELFQQDLSKTSELAGFVAQVKERFPHLSVLINSASGYIQASITETKIEDFDFQFATNLKAPFFLTQAFAAQCQSGNIINIIDNKIGFNQFQYAAYLMTKTSLSQLTKLAALEYAPAIRVNGVAPGVVLPAESRTADYIAWRVQQIPLQIQGDVEHIVSAINFILDNPFVTGQIITVDGGENITNTGANYGSYQASDD